MANCHDLFRDYDNELILTSARKKKLKGSRTSLRSDIRDYFKKEKEDEIQPKFSSQGSFPMGTIINPTPIKEGEETKVKYDMDDGIYFIGEEEASKRKECRIYHEWIVKAVTAKNKRQTSDKDTCVRVIYSDGHHIDLPIYYKKGDVPELAHKSKGWIESDPKEFVDWFSDKASKESQLKQIVRYMKGWRDARHIKNSSKKMPSGLILTILTEKNLCPNERDDIAARDTLQKMYTDLDENGVSCFRPTTPKNEDLFSDYSQAQKDYFLERLKEFLDSARQAIEEPNQKQACLKWQKHLGDRFPCHNAKDEVEDAKKYSAPAVIRSNAGSA